MAGVNSITGIILAAGKGTRMQSALPKVLHTVAGISMLEHVLGCLQKTKVQNICTVLSPDLAPFADFIAKHPDVLVCVQEQQNGTGGAVAATAPCFTGIRPLPFAPGRLLQGKPLASSHVLICAGDTPGLQAADIEAFIQSCLQTKAKLGVIGMRVEDPSGYGRLHCDLEQKLSGIIEEKDATATIKQIKACSSGVIFAETIYLFHLLSQLKTKNLQKEYYLTDCFSLAYAEGQPGHVYFAPKWQNFLGVNDKTQLQNAQQQLHWDTRQENH